MQGRTTRDQRRRRITIMVMVMVKESFMMLEVPPQWPEIQKFYSASAVS